MKVLIIIPAYNEQESIENVVLSVREHAPFADCLVVNDCSTDSTKKILRRLGASYLDLAYNLGIGGCVQGGYAFASENGYDIAVQFDGDGQHDASCIEKLIEPILSGACDYAIGSRFLDGAGPGFRSTGSRRLGIKLLSALIYAFTGVSIRDVTSGFRAANRRVIELFSREYAQDYPEPEAIVAAAMKGFKIAEVPVVMHERSGGKSSINAFRSLYYIVKVSLAIILRRFYSKGAN